MKIWGDATTLEAAEINCLSKLMCYVQATLFGVLTKVRMKGIVSPVDVD